MSTQNGETTVDVESGFKSRRAAAGAGDDLNLGRRIGPYRVERLIGRGGMGRVYLAAREADYEQRVALKLVEQSGENLKVLDRFYRERQILAHLQHPNIARILDGGTTGDALPFFVMEYVEGLRVDRYCEKHALSLRARLELFRKVCAAVHYAHQNLVVHRDLKPGNILVTAEGVPKLLDFGIAKILDADPHTADSLDTKPGERVMTFSYASPEQIQEQAITTASDVYSLGVLLYRLLSGRHPYHLARNEPAQMVSMICDEVPEPPSAVGPRRLRRQLAGEADAIVLKAMEKEPRERYASALQMAQDLERHLADQPVDAYPGSWLYRAAKRARRHKLGMAVALVIVGLTVATTVLWRQSVLRLEQAERAQLRSERISDFLVNLFKSADPDTAQGQDTTVRHVLDRGREKLTGDLADESEIRAELLSTLGTVYNNLALYQEARELKEEALRSRRAADPGDRSDLASDLNNLGRLLYDLGDYPAAESHFREALAMWRRLGDDTNAVFGMRNLAAALLHSGRHAEALELHRQILEAQHELFGARDPAVADSLYSLGILYRTRGDPGAAEPLLRQALEIFTESFGRRHTRVASVLSSLGRVLHDQQRYPEARQSFEQALDLRLQLLGEDHVHVANTRKNLAALLLEEGETAAAGELLEAALTTLRRAKPASDWTIADAESLWGSYLVALGRYGEAEPFLLTGYQTLRQAKGDEDVGTQNAARRVAELYEAWGQEEKAAARRAATEGVGR